MTLKGLLLLAGASGFVRNMNVAADGQLSGVETQASVATDAVRREGQVEHEAEHAELAGTPFHALLDWTHLPADGWQSLPKGTPLVHGSHWSVPPGMRETPVQKMKIGVHFQCGGEEGFIGGDIRSGDGASKLWKTWDDMLLAGEKIKPYAGHYENDDYQVTFESRSTKKTRPNGQSRYYMPADLFPCKNLQYDIHTAVHLDQQDLDRVVAEKKRLLTGRSDQPYTAAQVETALAALDAHSHQEYGIARNAALSHMKQKEDEYGRARREHMKAQVVSAFSRDREAGPAPVRSRGGDMDMDVGGMVERKHQKVLQLVEAGVMKKFEDITVFDQIKKWQNHKVGDKYGGVFLLGRGTAKNVQAFEVNKEQTYAFHFTQTCERDERQWKWEQQAELLGCAEGKKGTVLLSGAPGLDGFETGYFIGSRFVLYQEK